MGDILVPTEFIKDIFMLALPIEQTMEKEEASLMKSTIELEVFVNNVQIILIKKTYERKEYRCFFGY